MTETTTRKSMSTGDHVPTCRVHIDYFIFVQAYSYIHSIERKKTFFGSSSPHISTPFVIVKVFVLVPSWNSPVVFRV